MLDVLMVCTPAALQRVLGVVLTLLESPVQQQQSPPLQQQPGPPQPFVESVVQLLLTTPNLVQSLPAVIKVCHRHSRSQRHTCALSSAVDDADVSVMCSRLYQLGLMCACAVMHLCRVAW